MVIVWQYYFATIEYEYKSVSLCQDKTNINVYIRYFSLKIIYLPWKWKKIAIVPTIDVESSRDE